MSAELSSKVKRLPQRVGQWLLMHDVVKFFRANPQALALLVVCLVLGLGMFIAVMVGLISAGSTTTNGEPEGLIGVVHALAV